MRRLARFVAVCALMAGFIPSTAGQNAPKKSYTFHGTVEAVNQSAQSLRVNGEKVEGWMEAMTMNYKVDDPAIFKMVKAGDRISATVDDGDTVLHKVQVTPKSGADPKAKR